MRSATVPTDDAEPPAISGSNLSNLRKELVQMISSGELTSGSNLTSIGLPASFMLPFSTTSLTMHAAALEAQGMSRVVTEVDPLRRMLFILSNKLRATAHTLTASMMKPYNPVIGEMCIAESADVNLSEQNDPAARSTWSPFSRKPGSSAPSAWRAMVEQVSHHPPITASAFHGQAASGSFAQTVSTVAVPTFRGNYVEVSMRIFGAQSQVHLPDGSTEVYVVKSLPSIYLRGVMGIGPSFCEWAGDLVVECRTTGLVGRVEYKPAGYFGRGERHSVSGGVTVADKPNARLSDISGNWTQSVVAKMAAGGPQVELVAAPAGKQQRGEMADLPKPLPYAVPAHSLRWERHPDVVWRELTAALHAEDWNAARVAKASVERGRRDEKKAMAAAGQMWETSLFRPDSGSGDGAEVPWIVREGAFDRAFDPQAKPPCRPM
jgi:hypothetical protein